MHPDRGGEAALELAALVAVEPPVLPGPVQACRRRGLTRPEQVAEARLERNGDISVIRTERPPRVAEVRVADGVQTVRIELG
jgi:hypothetical protein